MRDAWQQDLCEAVTNAAEIDVQVPDDSLAKLRDRGATLRSRWSSFHQRTRTRGMNYPWGRVVRLGVGLQMGGIRMQHWHISAVRSGQALSKWTRNYSDFLLTNEVGNRG